MNARIRTSILAFAVALAALAPGLARAQDLPILTASSANVNVTHGSYFLIVLATNPTTGYSWSVTGASRPGVVRILGSHFVPPTSRLMGAGGTFVCLVQATGRGATTLTLRYARPFERGGGTTQKFTVTVTR